jgi:tetratricopeptide (TPR) repeat protein
MGLRKSSTREKKQTSKSSEDSRRKPSANTLKGRLVEEVVALLHDLPAVKVERNVFLNPVKGADPEDCEIDVLLTTETGSGYPVQFAIECKNERGPIGIGPVREFLDKLDDVGIPTQLGIFVSASGFTKNAIRRAKEKGLRLFTLTGLSADRLSSAVAEAFQFNIYLIAQVIKFSLTNRVSKISSEQGFIFFDRKGNPCGNVPDLIWNKWRQVYLPSVIGEHIVELQVPKGWHQIVDGRTDPVLALTATVQVVGLVATHAGETKHHALVNPVDNKVERRRLNVTFKVPLKGDQPNQIVEVRTEEELSALMKKKGSVRVASRVRLPRIRFMNAFNYPLSRRNEELLAEHLKSNKSGEIPGALPASISEFEEADLKSVWEPVWRGLTSGAVPVIVEDDYGESVDVLGLMRAKEYAHVIALRPQFGKRPTPEFADVLAGAYLMQSNVLVKKAESKKGNEAKRLIERTVELIREALSLNPRLPGALNNLGLALSSLGRQQEALASFDRMAELDPDNPNVWINRAEILYRLKRYAEALESSEKALTLKPDDATALYNHARALNILGRYDEAVRGFDSVLLLRPDDANAWDERGDALMYLGEPARALESYENALKIRPDHFYALSGRGDALQHLDRFEEAAASYDPALKVRPESAETWSRRGQAMLNLRRFDEVAASYSRAIVFNPSDYEAYSQRAFALIQLNEFDDALESVNTALSLAPKDDERFYPLKIRAIVYHLKQMPDEAMADLLEAWKLNPDELMRDEVFHGLIANVYTASSKTLETVLLLMEMEWSAAAAHTSAGNEAEAKRIIENAAGFLDSLVVDDGSREFELSASLSGVVITGILTRSARRLVACGNRELAREYIGKMNAWVKKSYGDTLKTLDDYLAQLTNRGGRQKPVKKRKS